MSQKKEVPGSLRAFLKDGIEEAQCNICLEAFDNNHVPIQIKECGHHFGKGCLEKWLKTKASRVGTCPTCRGVLFTAKAKSATRNNQPTAPPTPDRFVQFYIESERARQSTRSGFLAKLWIAVQQLGRANALTTVFHPLDAVVQAYNQVNIHGAVERMPELRVLFPYISYFSHHNDNPSCPLIAVANTLCTLSNICNSGSMPSEVVWKAIVAFHTQPGATPPMLLWPRLRDTAWRLHEYHIHGHPPRDHSWRILYLFLCFMAVYRAERLKLSPVFKIPQAREMLCAFDFGFPTALEDARETSVRLLVSAAVYTLESSAIDGGPTQNERSRRLADCGTDSVQLKTDVEAFWLEALNDAEMEVAVGYPEHWWAGGQN
jgi:hypothetical protein